VIIPTYEYQYDTTAFRIYREAMPGYNIVGINSNSIIPLLGAIHCIVKEVGAGDPVFISHAALDNTSSTLAEYPVQAYIRTNSGVANAEVYWTTDTTQGFTAVPMTVTTNDTFECVIPAQPAGSEIFYYLSVQSNSGKTITKPITAPAGSYQFGVESTTAIAGDGSRASKRFILHQNYPNPFNPLTNIGFRLPAGVSQSGISDFSKGASGLVTLEIFDVAGRKVATLAREDLMPGEYEVSWDGRNEEGQRVASGVYLYRLEAEGLVKTRKMVLLK
jgi:hypothetical protein